MAKAHGSNEADINICKDGCQSSGRYEALSATAPAISTVLPTCQKLLESAGHTFGEAYRFVEALRVEPLEAASGSMEEFLARQTRESFEWWGLVGDREERSYRLGRLGHALFRLQLSLYPWQNQAEKERAAGDGDAIPIYRMNSHQFALKYQWTELGGAATVTL